MDSQKPPSTPSETTENAPGGTSPEASASSTPPSAESTPSAPPTSPTSPTSPPESTPPFLSNATTPPSSSPSSTPPPPPTAAPPPAQTPPPSGNKSKLILSVLGIIIVTIGFAFLVLWFLQTQQKQTAVEAIDPEPSIAVATQKIIVGTDPNYAPMEFLENSKLTGYDIDLANFIGKELGAQIEFKQVDFVELFQELENKKIDVIISTVSVTDERKLKYDFSEPYLNAGQVIITKKENTAISTTADLKDKKIGVEIGTTMETEAPKYTSDKLVIRYPDLDQATAALLKGEVDAISADLPTAKDKTNKNPSLKIASDPFTNEPYAVVFRKGDPSINDINEALSSLRVKGILADLKQQWLDP